MKVGEQLLVEDGAGQDCLCKIRAFAESREEVHLTILKKRGKPPGAVRSLLLVPGTSEVR